MKRKDKFDGHPGRDHGPGRSRPRRETFFTTTMCKARTRLDADRDRWSTPSISSAQLGQGDEAQESRWRSPTLILLNKTDS